LNKGLSLREVISEPTCPSLSQLFILEVKKYFPSVEDKFASTAKALVIPQEPFILVLLVAEQAK
jgi:hypothetical protein